MTLFFFAFSVNNIYPSKRIYNIFSMPCRFTSTRLTMLKQSILFLHELWKLVTWLCIQPLKLFKSMYIKDHTRRMLSVFAEKRWWGTFFSNATIFIYIWWIIYVCFVFLDYFAVVLSAKMNRRKQNIIGG